MSYMKGVRQGSEGNTSLLKSYGGGSSGPRQGYATGGSVGLNKDGPALSEGLSAAGTPAKPSLARPGRKVGKKKDAKTNINVIVAPSAPKEEGPPPMPPMAGPPGPPPMPPPGAGGPPPPGMPPMRASGGRVGYKVGGRVKKRADGGRSTLSADSVRAAQDERDKADRAGNFRNLSGGLSIAGGVLGAAIGKGGRAANFIPAAANAGLAKWNQSIRDEHLAEADRISKGRAKPGEEDRAKGGRVGYKIGGKVKKRADGGEVSPGEAMQAARKRRDDAGTERNERVSSGMMSAAATGAMMNSPGAGRIFRGLRALNTGFAGTSGIGAAISQGKKNAAQDEMDRLGRKPAVEGEEDRKHGGKVCRAEGGPVGGLSNEDGGAGGASGRLAKIKEYGK